MADSFLEIAPGGTLVPIGGKQIEAHGLPLRSIAAILLQYPALVDVLFNENNARATVKASDIAKAAPDAVADIILHGVKMVGNKKARDIADNLPGGEQLILLSTIIKRSIGDGGIGPLVEHVEALAAMGGPLMASDVETNSQSAMNSPLQ